jgi:hypothetical protein
VEKLVRDLIDANDVMRAAIGEEGNLNLRAGLFELTDQAAVNLRFAPVVVDNASCNSAHRAAVMLAGCIAFDFLVSFPDAAIHGLGTEAFRGLRQFCMRMRVLALSAPRDLTGEIEQEFLEAAKLLPGAGARATAVGEARRAADSPTSEPAAGQPIATTAGAGVAPRNAWFMQQYEARGTDTYRKPAKIHAKWDAMGASERAAICPDAPNKVTVHAVVRAIRRAIKKRDAKPPKKHPRAARKNA